MRTNSNLQAGDKVRLSGAFLKSTGQTAGGEGQAVWTVQVCPCRSCAAGRTVLTDQLRQDDGMFTPEEIAAEPHLQYRHILAVNVRKVGRPDGSADDVYVGRRYAL